MSAVEMENKENRNQCMEQTLMLDNKPDKLAQPPDGGWGWVVVLASFVIHLIIDGIGYSFGIFYYEILDFYNSGKRETAWVGSLAFGGMLILGPLPGMLTEKFGCRITTCVAAVIAATGFVLSAFSPTLSFLYFSFGIVSGVGFAFLYLPAVVGVGHYFEKKRTLAVGFASCGSGIGTFIFNPFTKILIDEYGWRGALLIQAGFFLNCVVCGTLFRPINRPLSTRSDLKALTNDDIPLEVDKDNLIPIKRGSNTLENGEIPPLSLYPAEWTETKSNREGNCCCFYSPATLLINLRQFSALFGFSLLKNVGLMLYLMSNFMATFGSQIPFVFLYDFSIERGVNEDSAKWLGSVIGLTNVFGRALCGIIADRANVNKLVMFSVCIVVLGVATAVCSMVASFAAFVVFSTVFGLFNGMSVPLWSVLLVDILGLEMLNNSFGLFLMFKGIAILTGPPFAGWLFDLTESYTVPFITSGVITTVGGLMVLTVPLARKCMKQEVLQVEANA